MSEKTGNNMCDAIERFHLDDAIATPGGSFAEGRDNRSVAEGASRKALDDATGAKVRACGRLDGRDAVGTRGRRKTPRGVGNERPSPQRINIGTVRLRSTEEGLEAIHLSEPVPRGTGPSAMVVRRRRTTGTAQPTVDHASGSEAICSPYVVSRNDPSEGLMERSPSVVRFPLYQALERVEPRYHLGAERLQIGTALDKSTEHPVLRATAGQGID